MTKPSDTAVSGALKSDPKQNARDAERLFGADEEGREAEDANKAMGRHREAGQDREPLGGTSAAERFGSPD